MDTSENWWEKCSKTKGKKEPRPLFSYLLPDRNVESIWKMWKCCMYVNISHRKRFLYFQQLYFRSEQFAVWLQDFQVSRILKRHLCQPPYIIAEFQLDQVTSQSTHWPQKSHASKSRFQTLQIQGHSSVFWFCLWLWNLNLFNGTLKSCGLGHSICVSSSFYAEHISECYVCYFEEYPLASMGFELGI